MIWFLEMKEKYRPELTPNDFSDLLIRIEDELVKDPEFIHLSEDEQNKLVEKALCQIA